MTWIQKLFSRFKNSKPEKQDSSLSPVNEEDFTSLSEEEIQEILDDSLVGSWCKVIVNRDIQGESGKIYPKGSIGKVTDMLLVQNSHCKYMVVVSFNDGKDIEVLFTTDGIIITSVPTV
ncbi:MAG: hypothetical protein ACPGED_11720 [Flavobacteriales bacterium]